MMLTSIAMIRSVEDFEADHGPPPLDIDGPFRFCRSEKSAELSVQLEPPRWTVGRCGLGVSAVVLQAHDRKHLAQEGLAVGIGHAPHPVVRSHVEGAVGVRESLGLFHLSSTPTV